MAGIDAELLERVARWCAEAGRQAGPAEIRGALEPLGWDELLAVRALLAGTPPARPLGPHALADIARGAPPDLAAEREREGRYRAERDEARRGDARADAGPARAAPSRGGRPRRGTARGRGVVIRRSRDLAPPVPPAAAVLPPLDELLRPEGRAVLERLVRTHGGRRAALAAALAAGWRRPAAGVPAEEDLARLLEHHGLSRAFERRERDELLHALRAAGGVRAIAAVRVGLDAAALDAALERLGATEEAERIREARRVDVRARATLSRRVRLLLADEPRLRDLGLLAEIEDDVRARLPDHVRALRGGGGPIVPALARSLSLTPAQARTLAGRFGLDVGRPPRPGAVPQRPTDSAPRRGPRAAPRRPGGAPGRRPGVPPGARRGKGRGPSR